MNRQDAKGIRTKNPQIAQMPQIRNQLICAICEICGSLLLVLLLGVLGVMAV